MTYEIEIGINTTPVARGHQPSTYIFRADVCNPSMGQYGIYSDPRLPTAAVTIDLPEYVQISRDGAMVRPGCTSKSGTMDRCYVTCDVPAAQDCEYYGACDYHALITRALAGGLTMHYPEHDGSMAAVAVKGTLIGWREGGSRVIKPV